MKGSTTTSIESRKVSVVKNQYGIDKESLSKDNNKTLCDEHKKDSLTVPDKSAETSRDTVDCADNRNENKTPELCLMEKTFKRPRLGTNIFKTIKKQSRNYNNNCKCCPCKDFLKKDLRKLQ